MLNKISYLIFKSKKMRGKILIGLLAVCLGILAVPWENQSRSVLGDPPPNLEMMSVVDLNVSGTFYQVEELTEKLNFDYAIVPPLLGLTRASLSNIHTEYRIVNSGEIQDVEQHILKWPNRLATINNNIVNLKKSFHTSEYWSRSLGIQSA